MFAKWLKLRLLLLQGIFLAAVFTAAVMADAPANPSIAYWSVLAGLGAIGLSAAIASYLIIGKWSQRMSGAVEDIEGIIRDAGRKIHPPEFSAGTRKILPEMTAAIDRAVQRIGRSYVQMMGAAWTDTVTRLPNRLHFVDLASKYLPCQDGEGCALLFLDLDRFKSVNDSLGHAMGDELLRAFTRRTRKLLTQEDAIFARFAGDEFTILLPGMAGVDAAEEVAENILQALHAPFRIGEHQLTIGASIGICKAPKDGDNFDILMRNADAAMYRAKALGRNRAQTFEPTMHEDARQRLDLETCLRGASEAGQFVLHLQPQIDCQSGEMSGAEALIRWNHPERGLLSPAEFIAVAEDTGMILDVGCWVLEESLAMIGRLRGIGPDFRLSVNVSLRQMEAPDFLEFVENALTKHGVHPRRLEIEITESLVMEDLSDIAPKLAYLRSLGISIAVDDFGTGYSNLARLKTLPIDRVKIDRSLVRDIGVSGSARTIVQAIIGLVRGLGYQSVAEGVESTIQQDVLTIMGCDTMQGYGLARPMTEEQFIAWTVGEKAAA